MPRPRGVLQRGGSVRSESTGKEFGCTNKCAEVVTIVFPSTKNFTLPRSLPEPQGCHNCSSSLETIGNFLNGSTPKMPLNDPKYSILIGFSILSHFRDPPLSDSPGGCDCWRITLCSRPVLLRCIESMFKGVCTVNLPNLFVARRICVSI